MDNRDRQTVTSQVKNLGEIIMSPLKQKDGTHVKWFQFAAVTKDGTKHGVSFFPPLHSKLMVTNNDQTIALTMKNVFKNDQHKLNAETCLVETVTLKEPFSMNFEPVKSIVDVIFELPLDTMTSIRGKVTNIEVKKTSNSTIHFYTITDNSSSIVLFSYKKLDLQAKLSYNIKNGKVTHYSQGRQAEWSLSSTITQNDQFKLEAVVHDDIQNLKVNTLKLVNEQKCCICKHLLSTDIIDEDNIYTCSSCENMLCEKIVKKGANCTVKVNGGNNEYFLNEKLLAAAGGG